MAVTAEQQIRHGSSSVLKRARQKVLASTTIYKGALCFLVAASGYLTHAIATGANRFAGVATDTVDNSGGASGDKETETIVGGTVTLINASHSLTLADKGKDLYASDNYTVTVTSTNNVLIGRLSDIDNYGDPVIELKAF